MNTLAMGLFGTKPGQIDTLVLGCTHYPFVSEHLQALVGFDVTLVGIFSGGEIARHHLYGYTGVLTVFAAVD